MDDQTAGIELKGDAVFLDGDHATVDAAGSQDFIAHGEVRLELFELLLALALGGEEQEVHAYEKQGVHSQDGPATALLIGTSGSSALSLCKTLIDNSLDSIHCSYCMESGERERQEM